MENNTKSETEKFVSEQKKELAAAIEKDYEYRWRQIVSAAFLKGGAITAKYIKQEIESNLCAVSGMNDEYAHGYENCGMAVIKMLDQFINDGE